MPDDRFFHKRAGHSEKVNRLTDFEELIWRYYVLSSDDFGVMRFTAAQIRADHARAGRKSERIVMRALEQVRGVELVHVFEHQGQPYCYSRNWQRYQKIEYPRETSLPMLPQLEIDGCEPTTAELFMFHPGGNDGKEIRKFFTELEQTRSQTDTKLLLLTRARTLAKAKANGSGQGQGSERVGRFVDRYRELHEEYIGVAYLGNPHKDYQAACELVAAFDDPMLEAISVFGLNDTSEFMADGTRTLTKLKSRASDYAQHLKAKKLA